MIVDIIDQWNRESSKEELDLVNLFLSPSGSGKRFLFGTNEDAIRVSEKIEITGFINDFWKSNEGLNGIPVVNTNNVPHDAIIVNCSTSISPLTVQKKIDSIPNKGTFPLTSLSKAVPSFFELPEFVRKTRSDLVKNGDKWQKILDTLADERSKEVFHQVLKFRLTGDLRYMTNMTVRFDQQYFAEFIETDENEVFVDCGGFDGDTTEIFCDNYPNYKKVLFFEPSAQNMTKAKERLNGRRDIEYIPKGVSDQEGVLSFSSGDGSSSKVSEQGGDQIEVTKIDKYTSEPITFIKMDLEGWEMKALKGAENHIKKDHPKLAIAVYHSSKDFWEIFNYILSLRSDYKVYLDHYTEGWSETVMYFIPMNRASN